MSSRDAPTEKRTLGARIGSRSMNQTSVLILWFASVSSSIVYLVYVYLLPLTGLAVAPPLYMKVAMEVTICAATLMLSVLFASAALRREEVKMGVDDDVFYTRLENTNIGTGCFEIVSASSSLETGSQEPANYNTALLLALRNGMAAGVSMAYEAGVAEGTPFLRLFMTASGSDPREVQEILKREATRAEAILLSSLCNVELSQLKGSSLQQAVSMIFGPGTKASKELQTDSDSVSVFAIRGLPRVSPSSQSSQIGTFLSTALKQGYNVILTCVFSPTSAGSERRKMEGKWRSIQSKEKRKDDTLADQTTKQRLLAEYEKTNGNDSWFKVSTYVSVAQSKSIPLTIAEEGVKGLILSTWGDEKPILLSRRKHSGRNFYRLLTRRHLDRQKLHVGRLAAFVNTPVQHVPVVSTSPIPAFIVPPREHIDNELVIGWTVYGGKYLSRVGLKPEWLREHVVVLGATGTGKTTLVKRLVAELSKKTTTPWWIFDLKGSEYSDLSKVAGENLMVLRPGLDPFFVIDLLDRETDSDAHTTFVILRELLRERSTSSELSPAMEKLLRNAVVSVAQSRTGDCSVSELVRAIDVLAGEDRVGTMTKDALINRMDILTREPLGRILGGGKDAVSIASLLDKRVIFDLRHVARTGGMEAARLLYNLVAKRIFDASMRRGITDGLQHVVVLEEASNLVPETYTKASAADVTTGESMVMLQRATGQGVIVISTRPNISSNILANAATKFTFRLPYDSPIGARYMSLDSDQEKYLRSLRVGRTLASIPGAETFEVATMPFLAEEYLDDTGLHGRVQSEDEAERVLETAPRPASVLSESCGNPDPEAAADTAHERTREMVSQVLALLASNPMVGQTELVSLVSAMNPALGEEGALEFIRELVSRGTIEREALPLVPGGFVFALSGRSLEAVRGAITRYLTDGLHSHEEVSQEILEDGSARLFVGNRAIIVVPGQLKASTLQGMVDRIRGYMNHLGNGVVQLMVVVRGSVAAAKLRETMDRSEDFDAVTVASAFPTSMDNLIQELNREAEDAVGGGLLQEPHGASAENSDGPHKMRLVEAMDRAHEDENPSVQMRLWFGLLQGFVNLTHGRAKWNDILDFVETTSVQTLRSRGIPLDAEIGKHALTELLADEAFIAIRVGHDEHVIGLEEGLWVVNTPTLKEVKDRILAVLDSRLTMKGSRVGRNHEYYDICGDGISYVVFPTQQQLSTLLRLHSNVACRTCGSRKVVCILTASEYVDDGVENPNNLTLRTLDEGLSVVVQ